jgi:hypothetical protein
MGALKSTLCTGRTAWRTHEGATLVLPGRSWEMSTTSLNRSHPPCSCCWHWALQSRIPDDTVHVPGFGWVSWCGFGSPNWRSAPPRFTCPNVQGSLTLVSVERPGFPMQIWPHLCVMLDRPQEDGDFPGLEDAWCWCAGTLQAFL